MRSGNPILSPFVALSAALSAALFGVACGPTNISLRDVLATRASFDLQCPKEKLTFVPFSENEIYVTSYGVTGCGQRAVYLINPGPTWSLDARSEDRESPTSTKSLAPEIPAAPPPPPPEGTSAPPPP